MKTESRWRDNLFSHAEIGVRHTAKGIVVEVRTLNGRHEVKKFRCGEEADPFVQDAINELRRECAERKSRYGC